MLHTFYTVSFILLLNTENIKSSHFCRNYMALQENIKPDTQSSISSFVRVTKAKSLNDMGGWISDGLLSPVQHIGSLLKDGLQLTPS